MSARELKSDGGRDRHSDRSKELSGKFFWKISSAVSSHNMTNFAGTWKMKSSENFDELLKALGKLFLSFASLFAERLYEHHCMRQTRHALE